MKAMQAIKKMVALGMGLTMVGATIFGASAAKLSDYPAPFVVNGTPASNLASLRFASNDNNSARCGVCIFQKKPNFGGKISCYEKTVPNRLHCPPGDIIQLRSTT